MEHISGLYQTLNSFPLILNNLTSICFKTLWVYFTCKINVLLQVLSRVQSGGVCCEPVKGTYMKWAKETVTLADCLECVHQQAVLASQDGCFYETDVIPWGLTWARIQAASLNRLSQSYTCVTKGTLTVSLGTRAWAHLAHAKQEKQFSGTSCSVDFCFHSPSCDSQGL